MFGLSGANAYWAMVLIGLAVSGVITVLVMAPSWTRSGRTGAGDEVGPEPALWIEPPADAAAPAGEPADGEAGGARGNW